METKEERIDRLLKRLEEYKNQTPKKKFKIKRAERFNERIKSKVFVD